MKETYDLVTYRHKEDLPKEQLLSAAKLYCRIWKEKPWEEKWTVKKASEALCISSDTYWTPVRSPKSAANIS